MFYMMNLMTRAQQNGLILCLYILAFICFFFPSFFFSSHVSAFVLRRLTRDEDHEDYRMGGVGGS